MAEDGDSGVRPCAPRAERRPLTEAALGIAASCNADSTNRSNIKLEAHRLKCVASHDDRISARIATSQWQ